MRDYTGTTTLESMSQAGAYNKWTLSKFKEFLKGEILEIGCGIGNFTSTLSNYGKVTAVDIDKVIVKKFEDRKNPDISIGYGDIEKGEFFFDKKKFDSIICINVLEHIQNDIKALDNIFELLQNGGNLVLLVPIYSFLYGEIDREIGHFRRYNPNILIEKMRKMGFEIISYRKLNFIGAIGWFISGKILKNKQISENKIKMFNLISPLLYLEDLVEPPVGTSILIIARKKL